MHFVTHFCCHDVSGCCIILCFCQAFSFDHPLPFRLFAGMGGGGAAGAAGGERDDGCTKWLKGSDESCYSYGFPFGFPRVPLVFTLTLCLTCTRPWSPVDEHTPDDPELLSRPRSSRSTHAQLPLPFHGTVFAVADPTYHNITVWFEDEQGEPDKYDFTHEIRRSRLIALLQVGWYDSRLRKCVCSRFCV
jgi:hypothetical protein